LSSLKTEAKVAGQSAVVKKDDVRFDLARLRSERAAIQRVARGAGQPRDQIRRPPPPEAGRDELGDGVERGRRRCIRSACTRSRARTARRSSCS